MIQNLTPSNIRPVTQKPTEDLRQEYESFGGTVTELPSPEDVRDLTTVILKIGTAKHLYKMVEGEWLLISQDITQQENPTLPEGDNPVSTEEHRGQAVYVQEEEPTDQQINDLWITY